MIASERIIGRIMLIATSSVLLSACASLTEGYANSWAGFQSRSEMCKSAREFVRSPLPDDGLRRAWFMPFGSYDDGTIDFYAPMGADPFDEHSNAFYKNRVGQLTHYLLKPKFASAVTSCFSTFRGFSQDRFELSEDDFRASIRDRKTKRRIEVAARNDTVTFLVASGDWSGKIEELLYGQSSIDHENED